MTVQTRARDPALNFRDIPCLVIEICLGSLSFQRHEIKVRGHPERLFINEETKNESLLRSPFFGLMSFLLLYPNF
jgi:hypothetical protein